MPEMAPAMAEIYVALMICVILLVDLFISDRNRVITYVLSLACLVGAFVITYGQLNSETQVIFSGTFIADKVSALLKLFTYVVVGFVFVYSRGYLVDRQIFKGEYYVLGLFATLGMMVMISAHNFLTVYLGLELLSLSLYAMVAFNRDSSVAAEAGIKYFVLGAIASGALLYGASILYGVTGTLDLGELAAVLTGADNYSLPVLLGVSFLLMGVAFKLGAVPFHMWLPDVYHGAPTSVTLFIGTAPKIAAFALVLRMFVDGMGDLYTSWSDMLIILSILSMAIGNIVAIAQSNIKRMLAYSTISHVGFILLGFAAGGEGGVEAALFYTLVYAVMSAAAFGVVIMLSRVGFEADTLDDFKGLNERSPWYAAMMLLVMFSMAGVPIFVGFHAKWIVISAVLDAGLTWLAVLAVIFSVIGAFYYLRVVKHMYFDKAEDSNPVVAGRDMHLALSVNGLAILALGLFPNGLLALCANAIG